LDKSGAGIGQVWYPPLEADESFWKPVISPDKFGEHLEKYFWMVKHLTLSQDFFKAS
jgi:hypothetical protein